MRKIKYILIGLGLLIASTVTATQISVPSAPGPGYLLQSLSTGNYFPVSLRAGSNISFSTTTSSITISSTGGSGGGTWATSTAFSTTLLNYPLNATDVVMIGSTGATSTAKMWFDPNSNTSYFNGKVGIGTVNPNANLNIYGTAANPTIPNLTTSSAGVFRFSTNTGVALDMGAMSASPYSFWLQAGDSGLYTEPISLNPLGGNVGIGTTTPASLLNIAGASVTTAPGTAFLTLTNTSGISQNQFGINFINQGYVGTARVNSLLDAGGATAKLQFLTGGAIPTVAMSINGTNGNVGIGTTSPFAKLSIEPLASNTGALFAISTTTANSTSTAFLIDSNGKVGIGTTSPSQQLSVTGNGYFTGNLTVGGSNIGNLTAGLITSTSTGNNYFAGNVGIGTTTPAAKLQITGGAGGASSLATAVSNAAFDVSYANNNVLGMYTGFITAGGGAHQYIQAAKADGTTAYQLTLNPYGGFVGIGSTSPSAKLSIDQGSAATIGQYIAGFANATADMFRVSTSTLTVTSTAFIINSNGKVGIGTTTPTSQLEVAGSAYISGSLTGAGLTSCTGGTNAVTWSGGTFGCQSISATGGAYPFTPSTSWGALVQATTSELAMPQILVSSSTIGTETVGYG